MISLCQKKFKKGWGVHRVRLEIKRITEHRISRSFSHLGRFWIHYYQQKNKWNREFYLRYVQLYFSLNKPIC